MGRILIACWNDVEEEMIAKRAVQAASVSMGSAQKRFQSSWNSIRSWLTRPGLMPCFLLTSPVRSPCIRSRITRRSRSVRLDMHAGKSTRKAAWSGGGVCVLSCSACSNASPCKPLLAGRDTTAKLRCRCVQTFITSLPLFRPVKRRPDLTARTTSVVNVVGNASTFLPRSQSRRNHFHERAMTSAILSARCCAHLMSRKTIRACVSILGSSSRKRACKTVSGRDAFIRTASKEESRPTPGRLGCWNRNVLARCQKGFSLGDCLRDGSNHLIGIGNEHVQQNAVPGKCNPRLVGSEATVTHMGIAVFCRDAHRRIALVVSFQDLDVDVADAGHSFSPFLVKRKEPHGHEQRHHHHNGRVNLNQSANDDQYQVQREQKDPARMDRGRRPVHEFPRRMLGDEKVREAHGGAE